MVDPHRFDPSAPFLVGRDRERELLIELLAAVLDGRSRLALLSGEAGIGKTALAEALGRAAMARGARVLAGRCYDRIDTPPYGLWMDLFTRSRATEGLALPPVFTARGTIDPITSQAAVFNQILDSLRAAAMRQPLVLLLDDLHWADPASLDLLRFVSRALPPLPAFLIAGYRPDELARDHPLNQVIPLLVREAGAIRLPLRGLVDDDLRAYVAERYALAAPDVAVLVPYLRERTEGNPFFMTELLHALEEEGVLARQTGGWSLGDLARVRIPHLLQQVIDARLARLGAEAQRLLSIAAIIGQEVPLDLWRAVSGVGEDELLDLIERAVAARVLEETADANDVRFVHALIRQVLHDGMLTARRRIWHRAIAEALITAGDSDADPDAVAYHFNQAGDARSVAWLIRAGDRASRAFAYQTAVARLTEALSLIGNDSAQAITRSETVIRLARLLRTTETAQARQYADEAVRLADAAHDVLLGAVARFRLGYLRSYIGDRERGLAMQMEALKVLDAQPTDALERVRPLDFVAADLTARHGSVALRLVQVGRYREAAWHIAQALPGDGEPVTPRSQDAWMARAVVDRAIGEPEAAWQVACDLYAMIQAQEEHDIARWTIGNALIWAVLAYWTDNPARLREMRALLDTRVPQADELFGLIPPAVLHLPVLYIEGAWIEARQVIAALRATRYARHQFTQGAWLVHLLIALAQGETETAWEMVRVTLPEGARTEPGEQPFDSAVMVQRVAATLALDAGDLPAARAWLTAHDRWLVWSGAVHGQAEGALAWATYFRARGDHPEASQHAVRARALASAPHQPLTLLAAHRLLGELATEAGQCDAAAASLHEALALADACTAPYERALTLLALAKMHDAAGRMSDAAALLEEARALLRALGARPALARADVLAHTLSDHAPMAERLEVCPNSPAIVVPALPAGLTEREIAVLRLLAQGQSNREIGISLGITVRTAERHVSNIYTKIDAGGRAEAATFAFRHGLL